MIRFRSRWFEREIWKCIWGMPKETYVCLTLPRFSEELRLRAVDDDGDSEVLMVWFTMPPYGVAAG